MHDNDLIRTLSSASIDAYLKNQWETILLDDGRLRHVPGFIEPDLATELYEKLRASVPWEQMRFRGHPEPRLTCWMGDFPYRYSGVTREPTPLLPVVAALVAAAEEFTFGRAAEGRFRGVLLNYYRTGVDKIGLHNDAEPDLEPGAPIASLSFGATRRFVLRHNRSKKKVELPLTPGSLLIMEGETQEHWKHELPAEPRCSEGRINLTMRCRAEVAR